MCKLPFMLFALCTMVLHAEIQDYFKKAENKSGFHQMRNIDFIYMINLDQRPEKYELSANLLAQYGIHPYRFSAVNGWELTLEAINDLGIEYAPWMTSGQWGTCYLPSDEGQPHHEIVNQVGRNYFSHCMSRGAVGIVLSHLSVLQDAYDSGYETILVFEDDVEIIRDPNTLPDLIDKLDNLVGKEGWDILFTDQDTRNQQGIYVPCRAFAWRPNFAPSNPYKFVERQDISPDFRRIGARYGAYSMIVRRSGMQKLLNFFKNYQIFLPYDMEYTLLSDIHLYTVINDVISTQIKAISDNGAPNYKNREP